MNLSKSLFFRLFSKIEEYFHQDDKSNVLRTKNILRIPYKNERTGGKKSFIEWAHVIGIFQTIIGQELNYSASAKILDVGCGTGLLAIASEPFIMKGGNYTGIDVMVNDINFCKNHFQESYYKFIHFDVFNATYADNQTKTNKTWSVQDQSYDLVTALSVWTHLNEQDAIFYFREVSRVLKKGGKAIITFFILDDDLEYRSNQNSLYHNIGNLEWKFNNPVNDSKYWFSTDWANPPEDAIAVNQKGLDLLLKESGLQLKRYYKGNWKENPGAYFQDILVFEKG